MVEQAFHRKSEGRRTRRQPRIAAPGAAVSKGMLRVAARAAVCAAVAASARAATRTASPASPRAALPAAPTLASARAFFFDELHAKIRGRWGESWRTLYPLHRHIARRDAYVRCERATPFPAALTSLEIVSVRREPVHVAGLSHTVPGVALDLRLGLGWYGPRDPLLVRHTFHLVPVHGRWTWLLSADRYELYLHDRCDRQVVV
jgi:hypothetical protein